MKTTEEILEYLESNVKRLETHDGGVVGWVKEDGTKGFYEEDHPEAIKFNTSISARLVAFQFLIDWIKK